MDDRGKDRRIIDCRDSATLEFATKPRQAIATVARAMDAGVPFAAAASASRHLGSTSRSERAYDNAGVRAAAPSLHSRARRTKDSDLLFLVYPLQ